MKLNKKNLFVIIRDLFLTGFILFFVLAGLELIKPKIVLNYINLDLYLLLLLFIGAVSIMLNADSDTAKPILSFYDYLTILLFAVLIGVGTIFFLKDLGFLSILVGLIGTSVSYFSIILIYKGR